MFFNLLRADPEQATVAERAILDGWDDSHAPCLSSSTASPGGAIGLASFCCWSAPPDSPFVVFGIAINGDERAYPKRILAWHEMFKDTIGGEHFTGVYCTLCGSMILYRSDD